MILISRPLGSPCNSRARSRHAKHEWAWSEHASWLSVAPWDVLPAMCGLAVDVGWVDIIAMVRGSIPITIMTVLSEMLTSILRFT